MQSVSQEPELGDGRKTPTMNGAGPMLAQSLQMQRGGVTHMAIKTILRIGGMQFAHTGVTLILARIEAAAIDSAFPSPPTIASALRKRGAAISHRSTR